jgi:hypothetical protein
LVFVWLGGRGGERFYLIYWGWGDVQIPNFWYIFTKNMVQTETEKIIAWFKGHHLFSINGMCALIGADTSNFMKYLNQGKIQDKYLPKILNIIKQYGYD